MIEKIFSYNSMKICSEFARKFQYCNNTETLFHVTEPEKSTDEQK